LDRFWLFCSLISNVFVATLISWQDEILVPRKKNRTPSNRERRAIKQNADQSRQAIECWAAGLWWSCMACLLPNAAPHRPQVCEAAGKEYAIESALDKMEREWKPLKFEVRARNRNNGTISRAKLR
jgi:hypothetical protein